MHAQMVQRSSTSQEGEEDGSKLAGSARLQDTQVLLPKTCQGNIYQANIRTYESTTNSTIQTGILQWSLEKNPSEEDSPLIPIKSKPRAETFCLDPTATKHNLEGRAQESHRCPYQQSDWGNKPRYAANCIQLFERACGAQKVQENQCQCI